MAGCGWLADSAAVAAWLAGTGLGNRVPRARRIEKVPGSEGSVLKSYWCFESVFMYFESVLLYFESYPLYLEA